MITIVSTIWDKKNELSFYITLITLLKVREILHSNCNINNFYSALKDKDDACF